MRSADRFLNELCCMGHLQRRFPVGCPDRNLRLRPAISEVKTLWAAAPNLMSLPVLGAVVNGEPKWAEWRISASLPEQPDASREEIDPASIPKYGGFSTPQDEKAVLLRSK